MESSTADNKTRDEEMRIKWMSVEKIYCEILYANIKNAPLCVCVMCMQSLSVVYMHAGSNGPYEHERTFIFCISKWWYGLVKASHQIISSISTSIAISFLILFSPFTRSFIHSISRSLYVICQRITMKCRHQGLINGRLWCEHTHIHRPGKKKRKKKKNSRKDELKWKA